MPEPKFSILEAQFPDGGLDRKRPFWLQPPFTTPDCMNVWPYGAVPGRLRGGSRPGLAKAFAQRVGVGGPVRMLQCVSMVRRETLTTHVENLKDGRTAPGDGWRPAYDPESPYGAPTEIEPIEGVGLGVWGSGGIGGGDWAAYAWSDSHRIDRARPYVLEATVVPQEWTQNGALTLLACMDSPNSDAIRQSATFSVYANTDAGTWTSEFGFNRLRDDGFADFTVVPADGGDLDQYLTLRLEIRGSNFVAYVNGVRVGEAVASPAFTGSAVGWMVTSFQEAVAAAITTWSIRYHDVEGEEVHRTAVVASADGRLYAENVLGELDEVTGDYLETEDGDAITDENDDPIEISGASLLAEASLASAERLQQVFIADYGDRRVNDVACSVAVDSEGAKVTAASISDWTALGIDQENHGAIILPRTDGQADAVAPGTYRIINVRPGELVLLAGAEIGEGDCTLRVERVPKVYDSATGSLEPWIARTGQVPGGCGLLAVYRDRLVLARDHAWYMTRQGDPYDLDYAGADAGDAQRPVAGPASDAGTLGQEITALMPHSDDYMLVGCENSLWVMRGDPAAGGQLDAVSRKVGVISGQAWCSGPAGETYFLARSGLYVVGPGGAGAPENLSDQRLPGEFGRVDPSTHTVSLAYDVAWRGIHLYLTPIEGGVAETHYWFDLEHRSYWPVRHDYAHEPFVLGWRPVEEASGEVLLGCRDGYLRRYQAGMAAWDDGLSFDSWVVYGPLTADRAGLRDGLLVELAGTLADEVNRVRWSVVSAETGEAVVSAAERASGMWVGGLNYLVRPRVRGPVFAIILRAVEPGDGWQVERLRGTFLSLGEYRKW